MLDMVVARFKDGSLMKGSAKDFSVRKREFHLELIEGGVKNIIIEDLKALFFVKTLEGNKSRSEIYTDKIPQGGRKMLVEFHDGEVIIGYALVYGPDLRGFYLIPADIKSNNKRIIVVTSAMKTVTVMKPETGDSLMIRTAGVQNKEAEDRRFERER